MNDYFWLREKGNVTMEFNSPGMYRALRFSARPALVAIHGDEAKD